MRRAETTLAAAQRRMRLVFDRFDRVSVSVSGGKDSHVLFCLAAAEAERRGRKVEAFFLDQEAEYQGTIETVERIMRDPRAEPRWYQVPLRMTNATSHKELWLRCWEPGAEWMRPKSDLAIHDLPGAPDRFYDFFPWYEQQSTVPTAHLVGLRAREAFTRWRATARNHGLDGVSWSSKTAHPESFRFYPLFDWASGDVWKYLADHRVQYNPIYDRLYAAGVAERQMRVSYLLHEQSFRALARIQELEPETYERLLRRASGVHAAALYAGEGMVYAARKLPDAFQTWRAYREHLLSTTPGDKIDRFRRRFAGQGDDEATCKEHVRQLLTHDWENNVPVIRRKAAKLREQWWGRL